MQQIWFVVNVFFVASIIILAFAHRSLTEAKMRGDQPERVRKLHGRRQFMIVAVVILFIAMAGSFLASMKIDG
ncbi:hypothetical protein EBB07_30030 [Paenibacillaceae bacterium]|nr:hypothetical protein EBB07_30030 [Paenibacillaceae bacterium]